MTRDSVWRSAHATPSDASMQLLGCLLRSGSFESKMFGNDFFEAIQQAPAVTDAFALGGVEGIEALLCFLNPLLDFVVERAVLEAAAAAAASSSGGSGISVKDEANGHVKNVSKMRRIQSMLKANLVTMMLLMTTSTRRRRRCKLTEMTTWTIPTTAIACTTSVKNKATSVMSKATSTTDMCPI